MHHEPLDYVRPTTPRTIRGSPRFWSSLFVLSGGIALACIPTVFIFEHFHWWESPVHGTGFAACIVCALSAIMYLAITRRTGESTNVLGRPTRTLAYSAIALAGGFLLLLIAVVLLIALSPNI